MPFVSDENLTEIIPILEQLAWSSVYKEESLACHVTYPFNNKQGCFQDKINKIACQNYKYLSWMGMLSGKPVTPINLQRSLALI